MMKSTPVASLPQGWPHPLERVAALPWISWPVSPGISDRIQWNAHGFEALSLMARLALFAVLAVHKP